MRILLVQHYQSTPEKTNHIPLLNTTLVYWHLFIVFTFVWNSLQHTCINKCNWKHTSLLMKGRGELSGYSVGLLPGGPWFDSRCHQRPTDCMRCTRSKNAWFRKSRGQLLTVYHGCSLRKKFPSLSETSKLSRWTMNGAVIYRKEAEIGLLLLKNRPPNSGVTYILCLKPCTMLGLPSGTRQQQQLYCLFSQISNFKISEHDSLKIYGSILLKFCTLLVSRII